MNADLIDLLNAIGHAWKTVGLSPASTRPFLIGGLVLGYVREGGQIQDDRDIDFGVMDANWPDVKRLVDYLSRLNAEPWRMFRNNDGEVVEVVVKIRGVKVEFFKHSQGARQGVVEWNAFRTTSRDGNQAKGVQLTRRLVNFQVAPILIGNHEWNAPSPLSAYLFAQYGNGWTTPNGSWDYAADCPANIREEKWNATTAYNHAEF